MMPVLSQEKVRKFVKPEENLTTQDQFVTENNDFLTVSPNLKKVVETYKPNTPRLKPTIADSPVRTTASQIELRNMEVPNEVKFGIFRSQMITDAFDNDWRVKKIFYE